MPKTFDTAGPRPGELHYMLPPERRLGAIRPSIEEQAVFVVHAPRQSGKTTSFQALASSLTTSSEGSVKSALAGSTHAGSRSGARRPSP
ncbi:MAG: hypothetical protein MI919_35300 [Holophagales bacterium]|nr:hypothetical protein [Holophagales bacterium]